jgi:ABC-2 type transport system permease protein
MIADVWTVMWKEWKELLLSGGSLRGSGMRVLVVVGVFGILLPTQMGRAWAESPTVPFFGAWLALYLVTMVVADSFAGERERHTLETLLASRLSDRAILFGKLGAVVVYSLGLTWAGLGVALVSVNVAYGRGELLLYPAVVVLATVVLSFLAAMLAAGAGVFVSLWSKTVRQAQQTLGIAVLLLLFVPTFGARALPPEWKARLIEAVMTADPLQTTLLIGLILGGLDVGLCVLALDRFRRDRLIVD